MQVLGRVGSLAALQSPLQTFLTLKLPTGKGRVRAVVAEACLKVDLLHVLSKLLLLHVRSRKVVILKVGHIR